MQASQLMASLQPERYCHCYCWLLIFFRDILVVLVVNVITIITSVTIIMYTSQDMVPARCATYVIQTMLTDSNTL